MAELRVGCLAESLEYHWAVLKERSLVAGSEPYLVVKLDVNLVDYWERNLAVQLEVEWAVWMAHNLAELRDEHLAVQLATKLVVRTDE